MLGIRSCFKILQLAHHGVKNRLKMLIYAHVNRAFYSELVRYACMLRYKSDPAFHPSDRQSCSNLFETDLSPIFTLSYTCPNNFKTASQGTTVDFCEQALDVNLHISKKIKGCFAPLPMR